MDSTFTNRNDIVAAALARGLGVRASILASRYAPDVLELSDRVRIPDLHTLARHVATAAAAGGTVNAQGHELIEAAWHGTRRFQSIAGERGVAAAAAGGLIDMGVALGDAGALVVVDALEELRPVAFDACRVVTPRDAHDRAVSVPHIEGPLRDSTRAADLPQFAMRETAGALRPRTFAGGVFLSREDQAMNRLNGWADALGAVGRKLALQIDEQFAQALLEGSDVFYTAARGNRLTSSALSATTLAAAEAALVNQQDAQNQPRGLRLAALVVPPALEGVAEAIVAAREPDPSRRRIRVLSSPWLAHASIAGSSGTTWYALGSPRAQPAFVLSSTEVRDGRLVPSVVREPARLDVMGEVFGVAMSLGIAPVCWFAAVKATA